jgi:hypothetical protein
MVFVPLRATGDVKTKRSERATLAVEIYRKVTEHVSLAARCCTLVLDQEGLSEEEMARLQSRLGRTVVKFFPFRMYEDLLRDRDAIADTICSELQDLSRQRVADIVGATLDAHATSRDSASVLSEVFAAATDRRLEYRKVEHGVRLTKLLLNRRPSVFASLESFLGKLPALASQ